MDNSVLSGKGGSGKKTKVITEKAFHEVYSKTPKSVVKAGKTGKAKQAMMTAIALSKARAGGARIPKK